MPDGTQNAPAQPPATRGLVALACAVSFGLTGWLALEARDGAGRQSDPAAMASSVETPLSRDAATLLGPLSAAGAMKVAARREVDGVISVLVVHDAGEAALDLAQAERILSLGIGFDAARDVLQVERVAFVRGQGAAGLAWAAPGVSGLITLLLLSALMMRAGPAARTPASQARDVGRSADLSSPHSSARAGDVAVSVDPGDIETDAAVAVLRRWMRQGGQS